MGEKQGRILPNDSLNSYPLHWYAKFVRTPYVTHWLALALVDEDYWASLCKLACICLVNVYAKRTLTQNCLKYSYFTLFGRQHKLATESDRHLPG